MTETIINGTGSQTAIRSASRVNREVNPHDLSGCARIQSTVGLSVWRIVDTDDVIFMGHWVLFGVLHLVIVHGETTLKKRLDGNGIVTSHEDQKPTISESLNWRLNILVCELTMVKLVPSLDTTTR